MTKEEKKIRFSKKDSVKVLTLMKKELAEKGTVTEKALEMAIKALSK